MSEDSNNPRQVLKRDPSPPLSRALILAPMAGYTDPPFRALCLEGGADVVVAEMVSAKAIVQRNRKTLGMLRAFEGETPVIWQLFGGDPEDLAHASAYVEGLGQASGLDLNMGCPVPKITKSGAGSALMLDPQKTYDVVSAMVTATRLPVSVKMRSGWDSSTLTAPEIAAAAAEAGAVQVSVHGRTRAQRYQGVCDLEIIRKVKETCPVPVIGNGDITTPEQARRMFEETGVDGVSIARGSLGNPWIFGRIRAYLEGREIPPEPSRAERLRGALRHLRLALYFYGHRSDVYRGMKAHMARYAAGHPGASRLRKALVQVNSNEEMEQVLLQALGKGPRKNNSTVSPSPIRAILGRSSIAESST